MIEGRVQDFLSLVQAEERSLDAYLARTGPEAFEREVLRYVKGEPLHPWRASGPRPRKARFATAGTTSEAVSSAGRIGEQRQWRPFRRFGPGEGTLDRLNHSRIVFDGTPTAPAPIATSPGFFSFDTPANPARSSYHSWAMGDCCLRPTPRQSPSPHGKCDTRHSSQRLRAVEVPAPVPPNARCPTPE